MEKYRQQHSDSMTVPVFDELGPALKDIRNQLNALASRDGPRKSGNQRQQRRGATASSRLPADDGGKAGRVAYPVLVGEVSNL